MTVPQLLKILPLLEQKAWTIRPITYGWSADQKFYLQDEEKAEYLLRVSRSETLPRKNLEAALVSRFNTLDFPMSRLLECGSTLDDDWIFQLYSWVPGEELSKVLPTLPATEQYALGQQAGRYLLQFHQLPVAPQDRPNTSRIAYKQERIAAYLACPYRVEGNQVAVDYFTAHLHRIDEAESVYSHGDYHSGNMVYTPKKEVGILDFNRCRCSNPVREFVKLQSFDQTVSVPFCVGMLQGYWQGEPPQAFWEVLAVYQSYIALTSIVWAMPFGLEDVKGMQNIARDTLLAYDNFSRVVPLWYEAYNRENKR